MLDPLQYPWWRAEKEEKKVQQWCVSAIAIYGVKSWKRRKEGAAMMCQCHHNIHGEELKRRRQECAAMMCQFCCSSHGKELKKEKKMPNLCIIHAKHVTIIPKDIQLACNIHGKELITPPKLKMNYWASLWMMIIQQMKPSSSLLKMTPSSLIMRLKR